MFFQKPLYSKQYKINFKRCTEYIGQCLSGKRINDH